MAFPTIFSPIDVHGVTIKNRIIMGSMHTGLEEAPDGFSKLAAYYEARAKNEVGLIITGGISPNSAGVVAPHSAKLVHEDQVESHSLITSAVHKHGGKIAMQILHTGRYSYQTNLVGPSPIQAPINPFVPKELSDSDIEATIRDFVHCAELAKKSGYDGVEVMASEGYLLNQFTSLRTNKRKDRWGGSLDNRFEICKQIIEGIRGRCGEKFLIIYRLSLLDLVEEGATWEDTLEIAKLAEKSGVSIFNSGIGWHEARIPTIATMVPRATFAFCTQKLKNAVSIPVVATNRLNTPEKVEEVLSSGVADFAALARPFLADEAFVTKAKKDQSHLINTCIGCNQACLDHVFQNKPASCLVNPRACQEYQLSEEQSATKKKVAIVGAGVAGLTCAVELAQRGHLVEVFEAKEDIGGQFRLAKQVPGKEEFFETLRYFSVQLKEWKIKLHLNTKATKELLLAGSFDEVVISTGVTPRSIELAGKRQDKIVYYPDALSGKVEIGENVAIIGAGGIGFDVATFLSEPSQPQKSILDKYQQGFGESVSEKVESHQQNPDSFLKEWGIDKTLTKKGGLSKENHVPSPRNISLCQRKTTKPGATLGKTTGWIHRTLLLKRGVRTITGVEYVSIEDDGLHVKVNGEPRILAADHVVICAGQVENKDLGKELQGVLPTHIIGGAHIAAELDAKRAIAEAFTLAQTL